MPLPAPWMARSAGPNGPKDAPLFAEQPALQPPRALRREQARLLTATGAGIGHDTFSLTACWSPLVFWGAAATGAALGAGLTTAFTGHFHSRFGVPLWPAGLAVGLVTWFDLQSVWLLSLWQRVSATAFAAFDATVLWQQSWQRVSAATFAGGFCCRLLRRVSLSPQVFAAGLAAALTTALGATFATGLAFGGHCLCHRRLRLGVFGLDVLRLGSFGLARLSRY